jgi:hypothetical protein
LTEYTSASDSTRQGHDAPNCKEATNTLSHGHRLIEKWQLSITRRWKGIAKRYQLATDKKPGFKRPTATAFENILGLTEREKWTTCARLTKGRPFEIDRDGLLCSAGVVGLSMLQLAARPRPNLQIQRIDFLAFSTLAL